MSRDPLDELFGPGGEEPKPVPARERLAFEQAERVRTAQLSTEPRRRGGDRAAQAKPWIVVGVVAVLALIASILVVNLARGGGEPEPTAAPGTQAPTTTSRPTTSAPAETETPETERPDEDRVPSVDVGPTNRLDIPAWGVTAQLSAKFGMTSYSIPDNVNLVLDSPLINSLPDSCADMRDDWGITKQEDGTFTVRKPAQRCEAAPEVYDELWGLTAALVDSVKPL